jgi:hypothetical protein
MAAREGRRSAEREEGGGGGPGALAAAWRLLPRGQGEGLGGQGGRLLVAHGGRREEMWRLKP